MLPLVARVAKSKHMPNHLQGQKESPFTDFEMAVADANAKPDHIESRKKILVVSNR